MTGPMQLQSPDTPIPFEVIDAPGGFAWWYVDAFDSDGNGMVVIWSFGLPFLPGYLHANRRGRPQTPRSRPSLNVVTYRNGKPDFYLLQEYPADRCSWAREGDRELWTFGRSRFEARRTPGQVALRARIDSAVPGMKARLQGYFELDGPATRIVHADALPASPHGWNPISTPARLRSELSVGDWNVLDLTATGYFDRNASPKAFDELDIEHWIWGRSATPDRTAILFLLFPREGQKALAFSLQVAPDGGMTLERAEPPKLDGFRTARYGMPYWEAIELRLPDGRRVCSGNERLIEDGPFYLRTLGRLAIGDTTEEAVTEWIRPDRVDRNWQRPLVRMRVHRDEDRNSMWLPLFTGPREGRWGRLVQSWRSRA